MSTSLVSELERLADALKSDGAGAVERSLPAVAEKIARELRVKADEVAILAVSHRRRHLHFLVPHVLKNVGFIPLTSNSTLAARTARDSRPEINNNFSAVRHAAVFEGVKTAMATGESIQKIISAPILFEEKVVGVMQNQPQRWKPRKRRAGLYARRTGARAGDLQTAGQIGQPPGRE